ncbi:MAG: hypothetical protein JKY56_00900 [Kofleriaceae bacterium]|nr:hypothetical protein [Kofleriaceae bacterium]
MCLLRVYMIRLALITILVLSGCGNDDIDIVGDSPEVAAEEIATAVCGLQSSCTTYRTRCSTTDDVTTCEIESSEPDSYDECLAETQPEVYADLLCTELTAAQERLVNVCINKLIERGCPTLAAAEANAADIEAGRDPEGVPPVPECVQIGVLFDGCDEGNNG